MSAIGTVGYYQSMKAWQSFPSSVTRDNGAGRWASVEVANPTLTKKVDAIDETLSKWESKVAHLTKTYGEEL